MRNNPYVLSSDKFLFNNETKVLSAVASDFNQSTPLIRFTSGEVGIIIKSHKTQKEAKFRLVKKEVDNEGDLIAWHFEPLEVIPIKRVTIYND